MPEPHDRLSRGVTARIEPCSVRPGQPPVLFLSPVPSPFQSVQYTLVRIEEEDTEFAQSGTGTSRQAGELLEISLDPAKDLPLGLYQVVKLEMRTTPEAVVILTAKELGTILFEVVDSDDKRVSSVELKEKAERILAAREDRYSAGIGTGARQFAALVFVRDILVTRRMRIAGYEIVPFDGLGCSDDLDLIQSFMTRHQIGGIEESSTLVEAARRDRPTFVVVFPRIMGDDPEAAFNLANGESERVTLVLTLNRGSAGTLLGTVLWDQGSGQSWLQLLRPGFSGNLLGGFLSGEQPQAIRERTRALGLSPRALLYASLYREGRAERNHETQYFRFWSLLETVARSKDYEGRHKLDVTGQLVLNRHRKPQLIQDKAEDLVFELLRAEVLQGGYSERSFSGGTRSLVDDLPVWYQRRNCMVHGGPCACRRTNPSPNDRQRLCMSGRRLSGTPGFDPSLDVLRSVCEIVLARELHAVTTSTPSPSPS